MKTEYTTRALYDVIKMSLLMKDKDLVHFIRTVDDSINSEFKKVKTSSLTIEDIIMKYENYAIVYIMIKNIMRDAKISDYHSKVKEIVEYFLTDELNKPKEKPKSSYNYGDE